MAVIDSGLPGGYIANPCDGANIKLITNNQELEPFPYEGPICRGRHPRYHHRLGLAYAVSVRQAATEAEIWSYRALEQCGRPRRVGAGPGAQSDRWL